MQKSRLGAFGVTYAILPFAGGERRHPHRAGWLALVLLSSAATLGCGDKQPPLAPPKPPEVLVSQPVTRSDVIDYEYFSGKTEAVATVEIRARVTGYLEKANFKEGMEVKQGDVLFEIDPRTYQADLDRAVASVAQSEARLKRLEMDFERAGRMLARGAIGQEEYEKINGDRLEARAAVQSAKASRALAELNLGFTKVTAPFSGRISRRFIDPGNLVKADETPLTSIVSLDPIYAYFDVPERTVLRIRRLIQEGKFKSARETEVPLQMELADEEGKFPYQGRIDFVDNKVDPQTGTLWVRGLFANPKQILSPGLFVRVRVPIGAPHAAILIAERALGTDQGRKFLYVVNDQNEVVYRPVKIGPLQEGLRVIEEGLAPGEKVIVSGLQRVRPGAKVDPKPADMPKELGTAPPALRTETRSGNASGTSPGKGQ